MKIIKIKKSFLNYIIGGHLETTVTISNLESV